MVAGRDCPKALTRISREVRGWALHKRSDKSLTELAKMYNSCIRGWITYYSHFYRTQLRSTLKRIDAYVIKWARRKFKRMRHQTKGARDWFDRFRRANPKLLAHWSLCHGNGRTMGSRMNRTWPSPTDQRLGTPDTPAIRSSGCLISWLHWFAFATACQVARPPARIGLGRPRPRSG
jgi:hypothetical protein